METGTSTARQSRGSPSSGITDSASAPSRGLNLARDDDLAGHDFYLDIYRRCGFEPQIVHEVSQIATILFVIASTGCLALGPAGWRVLRRDGVALRPVADPGIAVATRLIWNPRRVSPALETTLAAARMLAARR